MKNLRSIAVLVWTLALCQCGALISAVVESQLEPLHNRDILSVQGNLVQYKESKSEWPQEVNSLKHFSDSIGMPLSNRFDELELSRRADSVYVKYRLRYEPSDSSKYEFIKGDFAMAFSSDTTIAVRHKAFEGKTKQGTSISSKKMDSKQLQQTRSK